MPTFRPLFLTLLFVPRENGFWKVFLHEFLTGLLKTLTNFASNTAIHGLGFLVKKSYSVKERLFWGAVFLSLTLYASLQLRVAVVCKYFLDSLSSISIKILVITLPFTLFLA